MESKRGYKGLQNVHSSNNEFNSLSFLTTSILNKIATTEIVVVRAVNLVACTVDVQPLVNQVDGAGRSYPHSIIHDLPFFRAQGGASGIILDPSEGDIGLVVFAGRDISSVKANRAPSPPGSGRRFDWTDGIYVGGALNSDPSQYIKFGVGITLKTPYPVTVDSPHTLVTGDLAIGTPLAVAYGGTQASTTAEARANLGVPGIDGSGAGGVWPISISGSAAGGVSGPVQWHDITGTGKPADYADVTATSAAMLAAVAELNNIASDSVLSKGEKPKAIQDWQAIQNEYTPWVSEATALSIGSELTVYIAKYNALSTYLSSLTNWTVTTVDTAINATAWSTAWKDYLYAKESLATACANKASLLSTWAGVTGSGKPADNATVGAPSGTYVGTTLAQTVETNASSALANAATANAAIADMASDNILSPVEKPTVILDYANILAEQSGIDTQAAAYGVTTEKTAYDSAITALTTYLNSLSGWNNTNTSTTIVGTMFRQKFGDVYSTRQTLLNKIAAVAGTLSTWAGVTGVGKPADYANATYVDIYGNIQGVSSGAGKSVDNSLLSIVMEDAAFSQDGKYWTEQTTVAPLFSSMPTDMPNDGSARTFPNGTYGHCFQAVGQIGIATKKWYRIAPNEYYQQLCEYEVTNNGSLSLPTHLNGYNLWDKDGAFISSMWTPPNDNWSDTWQVSKGKRVLSRILSSNRILAFYPNAAYMKPIARLNWTAQANGCNATTRLYRLELTDFTDVVKQQQNAAISASKTKSVVANPALMMTQEGALPDSWELWNGNSPLRAKSTRTGFDCPQYVALANTFTQVAQHIEASLKQGTNVLECDFVWNSGVHLMAAMVYIAWYDGSTWFSTSYFLDTTTTIEGVVPSGARTKPYQIRKMFDVNSSNITNAYVAFIPLHTGYPNSNTDRTLSLEWLNIRPATTDERNANSVEYGADVTANSAVIAAIWSDNILSRGEKTQVIKDWNTAAAEYSSLYASGTALGAITERNAYKAAYDALYAYLVSLSPSWSDTTQDTPIVGTSYRTYWTNFETARTALINKKGQLSQLDVVGTSNIINNAVSRINSIYTPANIGFAGSNAWTTAQTLPITSEGGGILCIFSAEVTAALSTSSSPSFIYLRVLRDGNVIYSSNGLQGLNAVSGGGLSVSEMLHCFQIVDTPSAGSHTYTLEIKQSGSSIGGISNRTISTTELKK